MPDLVYIRNHSVVGLRKNNFYRHIRLLSLLFTLYIAPSVCRSQSQQFSLSSDISVLRSFKKQQQYWAIGQTVTAHFHFTPKDELYAWVNYYGRGKFTNSVTAVAKSPFTSPQELAYNNSSSLSFKHISVGWKKYLKGGSNIEEGWSLYSYAGLGLLLAKVENLHSFAIDSADYTLPVLPGTGKFKRLTLDLGFGFELPVGGDIFMYLEGRTIIPTTEYPSNYLFVNKYAPLTGAANLGFRILFD